MVGIELGQLVPLTPVNGSAAPSQATKVNTRQSLTDGVIDSPKLVALVTVLLVPRVSQKSSGSGLGILRYHAIPDLSAVPHVIVSVASSVPVAIRV